jgi:hypothetical protein
MRQSWAPGILIVLGVGRANTEESFPADGKPVRATAEREKK